MKDQGYKDGEGKRLRMKRSIMLSYFVAETSDENEASIATKKAKIHVKEQRLAATWPPNDV